MDWIRLNDFGPSTADCAVSPTSLRVDKHRMFLGREMKLPTYRGRNTNANIAIFFIPFFAHSRLQRAFPFSRCFFFFFVFHSPTHATHAHPHLYLHGLLLLTLNLEFRYSGIGVIVMVLVLLINFEKGNERSSE